MPRPPRRPVPHNQLKVRKITKTDWHFLAFRACELFLLNAAESMATKGLRLLLVLSLLYFGKPFLSTLGTEALRVVFK